MIIKNISIHYAVCSFICQVIRPADSEVATFQPFQRIGVPWIALHQACSCLFKRAPAYSPH